MERLITEENLFVAFFLRVKGKEKLLHTAVIYLFRFFDSACCVAGDKNSPR